MPVMPRSFVVGARTETMLRDFDRLRKAIRQHDSVEAEAAWEMCERWVDQLDPNAARVSLVLDRFPLPTPLKK